MRLPALSLFLCLIALLVTAPAWADARARANPRAEAAPAAPAAQAEAAARSAVAAPSAITTQETKVELYTIGLGQHLFERYGHTLLCVTERGVPSCYDYGVFPQEAIGDTVLGSLQGKPRFVPQIVDLERILKYCRLSDRAVWKQTLDLDRAAAQTLANRLYIRAAQRQAYAYHPLRDNCSTQLRDLLDEATGHALQKGTLTLDGATYRALAEQGFSGRPLLLAGIELLVSSAADQPTSAWQRAFLPLGLRDLVRERLGAQVEIVFVPRLAPLPSSPSAGRLLLLALALLLIGLTYRQARKQTKNATSKPSQGQQSSQGSKPSKRTWLRLSGYLNGLLGLVLLVVAPLSTYPEFSLGLALLLFPITDFALGHVHGKLLRRYGWLRVASTGLLVALGLLGVVARPLGTLALLSAGPLLVFLLATSQKRPAADATKAAAT